MILLQQWESKLIRISYMEHKLIQLLMGRK